MRMIDRVIRSMQDTGLIDGMSLEDADALATAALEAMRAYKPDDTIVHRFESDSCHMSTYNCIRQAWCMTIDAALNE